MKHKVTIMHLFSFFIYFLPNLERYQTVFGPKRLQRRSMDLDNCNRALFNTWDMEEEEEKVCIHEDHVKQHGCGYVGTYLLSKV